MSDLDSRGSFRGPDETERAVAAVNEHAHAVSGPRDIDALVDRLAEADCVLLGEASHGTSEFYRRSRPSASGLDPEAVHHPNHESGNYVPTVLPERYDAFVHVDETDALHPLDLHPERERVPELYPHGL